MSWHKSKATQNAKDAYLKRTLVFPVLPRLRNFIGRLRYFTRHGLLQVYPWYRLHPITFDFLGFPIRLRVDYGLKAVLFLSVSHYGLVAVTGVKKNYGQNAEIASFRPCIHNLPQLSATPKLFAH